MTAPAVRISTRDYDIDRSELEISVHVHMHAYTHDLGARQTLFAIKKC